MAHSRSYIEKAPEAVVLAKRLQRYPVQGRRRSLREVAAELARAGYVAGSGKPYAPIAVAKMIG